MQTGGARCQLTNCRCKQLLRLCNPDWRKGLGPVTSRRPYSRECPPDATPAKGPFDAWHGIFRRVRTLSTRLPRPNTMVMPTTTPRYAVEEVLAFPADGNRYELVHGELLGTPAPGAIHQILVGELFRRLSEYLDSYTSVARVLLSPADITWGLDVRRGADDPAGRAVCEVTRARWRDGKPLTRTSAARPYTSAATRVACW